PLQPPNLPHAFDPTAAATLAADLAARWPSRLAGTPGAAGASRWFADQLKPYGYRVRRDTLTEAVPGRGRVRFVNLLATRPGRSLKTILVTAHRDDDGTGAGANDNASGTAALLELARAYAPAAGTSQVPLPYTLAFLSTDGAVDGGVGAAAFAAHAPEMSNVIAVLNLDAIAGRGRHRLVLTGDTPRSPTPGLVETVRARLAAESGHDPSRASALRQLIDLGFPFTRYEQAAFVSRGIPRRTGRSPASTTRRAACARPGSGRSAGPRRRRSTRCRRGSRSRPDRRATSTSARGSSAAGRSSSC